MARIKAKPMNRISTVGGGGTAAGGAVTPGGPMAAMKNGFRTPPGSVFDPTTGPFQPTGQPPGPQQRYIYSNGSSIPTAVNYSNQALHVYVSFLFFVITSDALYVDQLGHIGDLTFIQNTCLIQVIYLLEIWIVYFGSTADAVLSFLVLFYGSILKNYCHE